MITERGNTPAGLVGEELEILLIQSAELRARKSRTHVLGECHHQGESARGRKTNWIGLCSNGQTGYGCDGGEILLRGVPGLFNTIWILHQQDGTGSLLTLSPMIIVSSGAEGHDPSGTSFAPASSNSLSSNMRSGLLSTSIV